MRRQIPESILWGFLIFVLGIAASRFASENYLILAAAVAAAGGCIWAVVVTTRLRRIKWILGWMEGGVHKRIDENRELLDFLRRNHLECMPTEATWVEMALQSHDQFLNALVQSLPLGPDEGRFTYRALHNSCSFPRPWPGKTHG